MADASGNPADGYYSGRPLGYDPQQAQAQPQATAGGVQANGLPAPEPQPPQDVGEQVANHTNVQGLPGYYKARVNSTNIAAAPPPSAAAPVASPASAPAAPARPLEPEGNLSWIEKCLMCFTGGTKAR